MIEICFQDYKAILSKLHQGEKLVSILTTGKENYFQVLKLLIAHIPFKDAIHCANEMDTVHKGWIKNLLMPSIYPLFLFLFSYGMIFFFQKMILPAMAHMTSQQSFLFLNILQFVFTLFLFLLLILVVLLPIAYMQKKTEKLYFMCNRLKWFRKVMSLRFSVLMSALLGYGLSTRECIDLLSDIHHKNMLHPLVKQIQKELHKGHTLIQSLEYCQMDQEFIRFVNMGLHTSSIKELLWLYHQKVQKDLEQKTKKISLYIQIISYISVGIVVMTVYQILLLPMNILNTL